MKLKTFLTAILIILLTANVKSQSIDSLWYKEGAIYETHPYYYPNHSFNEITQQIPSLADLGIKTMDDAYLGTSSGYFTFRIYLLD